MDSTKLNLIKGSLLKYGKVRVRLEGKSMMPVIYNNDLVEIKRIQYKDVKVSDIIAFENQKDLIVHQCVYINEKFLVTWGVNNFLIDERVYKNNLLGKVDLDINTSLYNQLLFLEAIKINKGLKKINANPIWMKGTIYSQYLYGHFLNLKTPDLDILVNRKKIILVKEYLEKCGYSMEKKESSDVNELPYAEISFEKKIGEVKIKLDIHLIAVRCTFQKLYQRPFEPQKMILLSDELIKRPIVYKGFSLLNDTSSLFHLCSNLILHHAGRGIYDLARIAKLIDKGSIDWKRFERLANNYGLSSYVYYSLHWARNLFGIEIPIIHTLKPSALRHLLVRILINRLTICRSNRLITWLDQRINVAQVFYLRLVLQ